MLTVEMLKAMPAGTIFASGLTTDNADGLNMNNSGKFVKWVACRGGIHDWAIYCCLGVESNQYIKDFGDKVHSERHIKNLVLCDKEAFKMYRH